MANEIKFRDIGENTAPPDAMLKRIGLDLLLLFLHKPQASICPARQVYNTSSTSTTMVKKSDRENRQKVAPLFFFSIRGGPYHPLPKNPITAPLILKLP
jgi:hypothetical protein